MKPLSDWKMSLLGFALATGALLLSQPAQAGWPPPSFDAVYDIYMDGKPRMQTHVRFTRPGWPAARIAGPRASTGTPAAS